MGKYLIAMNVDLNYLNDLFNFSNKSIINKI